MRGVVASHHVVSAELCFGTHHARPCFQGVGQGGNSGGKRRTFQAKFSFLASGNGFFCRLFYEAPKGPLVLAIMCCFGGGRVVTYVLWMTNGSVADAVFGSCRVVLLCRNKSSGGLV